MDSLTEQGPEQHLQDHAFCEQWIQSWTKGLRTCLVCVCAWAVFLWDMSRTVHLPGLGREMTQYGGKQLALGSKAIWMCKPAATLQCDFEQEA